MVSAAPETVAAVHASEISPALHASERRATGRPLSDLPPTERGLQFPPPALKGDAVRDIFEHGRVSLWRKDAACLR